VRVAEHFFKTMIHQEKLFRTFPNIDNVPKSYSQIGQDIFVLSVLNGKMNGRYVEIGAYHPTEISNTYVLETYYNFSGISLDINQVAIDYFNKHRRNKAVLQNAITADYDTLFKSLGYDDTKIIDYASVDCEPPSNTFLALKQLMSSGYKFRTITFEHDTYQDSTKSIKQQSRKLLQDLGYTLLVGGILGQSGSYDTEDWYVHMDLVDKPRILSYMSTRENIWWAEYLYHTIPT